MNRTALAALALACVATPALADVAPVVIQAAPPPGASIPYGDNIVSALQAVEPAAITGLVTLIGYLLNRFAPIARLFLTDRLIESTLQKWLDYGLNEVAGAAKGKTLDFDTGSAVLNAAVNRATDRAAVSAQGKRLLELAGGPEEAARKLFRLLHLDEGASGAMLQQVIADLKAQGRAA